MKRFALLTALIISLVACTDVVELEVEDAAPALVVNGELRNDRDVFVKLQTTAGFFDNEAFTTISQARVSIWEDGQEAIVLNESNTEPGLYEAPFRGSVNKRYQLKIEINGDYPEEVLGNWISDLDTLRPAPQIDSMKQASLNRNTTPSVFEAGDYALIFFGDFEGRGDYYRIKRTLNDSAFAQETILINDEEVDGIYFGRGQFPPIAIFGPFEAPEVGAGPDSLTVEIQAVSKDFERYLTILQSQVQTGSPFDAPPAFIIGNIRAENKPENYAYGYFQIFGANQNGLRYTP